MKKNLLAMMLVSMALMQTSCHKQSDYEMEVDYRTTINDGDRVKYAEKTLGITIDKNQNWVLTNKAEVTVKVDADLSNIKEVQILSANPYTGETEKLAGVGASQGGSVTLSFRYPMSTTLCYAACLTSDGDGQAVSFVPGQDKTVSFQSEKESNSTPVEKVPMMTTRGMNRAMADNAIKVGGSDLQYTGWTLAYFPDLQNEAHLFLPEGKNNRPQVEALNSHSIVTAAAGGAVRMTYIGGRSGNQTTKIGYRVIDLDDPGKAVLGTFIVDENFDPANYYTADATQKPVMYSCKKVALPYRRQGSSSITTMMPGNVEIEFFLVVDGKDKSDELIRVTTYTVNGHTFVSCEDGDDNTFTDKMFFVDGAIVPAPPAPDIKPVPAKPQVWTYAWEDRDMDDYDMNDCVIRVKENAADNTKLDITLVAAGAQRDLKVYFAANEEDVFGKEIHEVLGVPAGTLTNTGRGNTVKTVTVTKPKPAGFDFQTNSFKLWVDVPMEEEAKYAQDHYFINIPTQGQDPHAIVIPADWSWPTERTKITDAYPRFAAWARDITDDSAKDWYKYPAAGKVFHVE